MKQNVVRWVMVGALAGLAAGQAVFAEEPQKTLPTLLIKGEVVSVDSNDPTAALLKVKDRYGFETPIYLTKETKIAQGDQTVAASSLAAGTPVEVEYNFDINTAKRHAVNVKISQPSVTASQPASTPASPSAPASTSSPQAPTAPAASASPASSTSAPSTPSAAPATTPAASEAPAAKSQ